MRLSSEREAILMDNVVVEEPDAVGSGITD